jgi:hypothetical protein
VPTLLAPNVRLVGLGAMVPAPVDPVVPVPVRVTLCGLLLAVSVKRSEAVRAPVAAGLKRTVTEQLADAARLAPQVLLGIVKSPALVPETAMLLMLIETVVPLCSVTGIDAPLEVVLTLPNASVVGLTLTLAAPDVPVPESATV